MRRAFALIAMSFFLTAVVRADDVEDLVKKLKDKDTETRRNAALQLGKLGPKAKEAAPGLVAALKDGDAFVRRYSAQALAVVGADPKTTVPPLAAVLADAKERKEVQVAVVGALAKMGGTAAPFMAIVMRDANLETSVRHKIIDSLADMGTAARPAVAALTDEFTGKNLAKGRSPITQDEKTEVLHALEKIATSEDKVVITALEAIANNEKIKDNDRMKKAVKAALKTIMERK